MALYSEAIETDSNWMWSSITSGTIGMLFLMGAFWGLSSNISNNSPIQISSIDFTQDNATTTIQVEPVKVTPKPNLTTTIKASSPESPKIKRSTKQNSTYAKTSKPISNTKSAQRFQLIKTISQVDQQVAITEPKVFKGTSAITASKVDLSKLNALEKNNNFKNIQLSALSKDKQKIPKQPSSLPPLICKRNRL